MSDRVYGPRTEIGTKIFNTKLKLAILRIQPEFICNYGGVEEINRYELYLQGLIGGLCTLEAIQERARQGVGHSTKQSEQVSIPAPRPELNQTLMLSS